MEISAKIVHVAVMKFIGIMCLLCFLGRENTILSLLRKSAIKKNAKYFKLKSIPRIVISWIV